MELKVGMYVRVNNDFRIIFLGIGKITKIVDDSVYVQTRNDLNVSFSKSQIGKPSFDLIDLIEVGDYVNDEKVTSCEPVDDKDTERYLGFGDYDYYIHTSEDIKSVVTKEQFNACKYVVERDK